MTKEPNKTNSSATGDTLTISAEGKTGKVQIKWLTSKSILIFLLLIFLGGLALQILLNKSYITQQKPAEKFQKYDSIKSNQAVQSDGIAISSIESTSVTINIKRD